MRKTAIALSMFSMLLVTANVSAAGRMRAGLWEMTMKTDAMKDMPKMSAEEMEQIRKMGVNIPQMGAGGMVSKVCISKEMAERDQPPMGENESGCKMTNYKRQGNSYTMDMVCDNAQMKGTGVVKGTFAGNESFNSTFDFRGTAMGQPANQHVENGGKWLSADCGNVKSMGDFKKR